MAFGGTVAIRAMKVGDFVATIYPGTNAGLLAALSYVSTVGGEVRLGPGTISVDSPLLLGYNVLLRGSGRGNTTIQASAAFSGSYLVSNLFQDGTQQWCAVENMQLDGNKSSGAVVPFIIYFKSIGQPGRIRDVTVNAGSGVGIKLEGGPTNAGNFLVENSGVSNCLDGGIILTGISAGYTFRDVDIEFVKAGGNLFYIDGPQSGALYPATILIDGLHLEGLLAGSAGVLIESARNVHVKDLVYFGSGAVGDLVRITGSAAEIQSCILENITAFVGGCANGLVDSVNSYTLAADGNGVNLLRYEIGTRRSVGATTTVGTQAILGTQTVSGNATFGTAGVAENVTVGGGGANAAAATLAIDSGNTGATQSSWSLRRNTQVDFLGVGDGTSEFFQFRHLLQFYTMAGALIASLTTAGKLRVGDNATPAHWFEPAAGTTSVAPMKLTAGTNLTSATAGCVEYDGTNFYITATNGARCRLPMERKGSDIASAATIAIPADGDVFHVTGAVNITNGITVNATDSGRTVVLIFDSTPTVTDTGTSKLNGNFVATADDTLTLKCDGTNWFELGRSVN